jgi:hypothetical protein
MNTGLNYLSPFDKRREAYNIQNAKMPKYKKHLDNKLRRISNIKENISDLLKKYSVDINKFNVEINQLIGKLLHHELMTDFQISMKIADEIYLIQNKQHALQYRKQSIDNMLNPASDHTILEDDENKAIYDSYINGQNNMSLLTAVQTIKRTTKKTAIILDRINTIILFLNNVDINITIDDLYLNKIFLQYINEFDKSGGLQCECTKNLNKDDINFYNKCKCRPILHENFDLCVTRLYDYYAYKCKDTSSLDY